MSYRKMLNNKAKRLLIPYLVFGLFYVAPVVKLLGITELSFPKYILFGIILGADSRHLWYLFTLFLIFTFTGIIDKMIRHRWNIYVLAGLFVFWCCVSSIYQWVPSVFAIGYFVRYYCYFIFGMIVAMQWKQIEFTLKKRKWIPVICLGLFLLSFVYREMSFLYAIVAALSGITFLFGIAVFNDERLNKSRITKILSDYSMGIYIIHPMIIYFWFYLIHDGLNTFVSCVCVFAISMCVSLTGVKLIRKARLQFLIGEYIQKR